SADETSENKAGIKVRPGEQWLDQRPERRLKWRRGKSRGGRHRVHALDCGSTSTPKEWERHQNGFWTEGAAGTGKNRGADHAAAGAAGAKRGNGAPDPAIARSGERPSPRDFFAPEPMGAHGTGAASAAFLYSGLYRAHFHQLERNSRGSRVSRRSGDCLRHGSLPRRGNYCD